MRLVVSVVDGRGKFPGMSEHYGLSVFLAVVDFSVDRIQKPDLIESEGPN
ncbi:MAG: hypothetical protein QW100_02500 [Thermoplasmatales archaeon]